MRAGGRCVRGRCEASPADGRSARREDPLGLGWADRRRAGSRRRAARPAGRARRRTARPTRQGDPDRRSAAPRSSRAGPARTACAGRSGRPRAARRSRAASARRPANGTVTRRTPRNPAPSVHSGTVAQEASTCPAPASTTQTAANTAARSIRRSSPERAVRGWGAVMAGSSSHWPHGRHTAGPQDDIRGYACGIATTGRSPSGAGRPPYTDSPPWHIDHMGGITSTTCLQRGTARQYVTVCRAAARRLEHEHLVVTPSAARGRERAARPAAADRHHGDRGGRPRRLLRPLRRPERGLRQRRRARRGHRAGRPPEAYRVTAYLDGETCHIEVADSGPGFPPPRRPPGIRLARPRTPSTAAGLCLIQELADHVHIGNKPGRSGAVVSFDKILKWKKDPSLMAV